MLNNPKWDKWDNLTVIDYIYTNEALAAWLEKQNPHETYPYADPVNCMLAQYFDQTGDFEYAYVHAGHQGSAMVSDTQKPSPEYRCGWHTVPYNPMWDSIAKSCETYGQALRILKTLM